MVWWMIRFFVSKPGMPTYVGPFSNHELAKAFIAKHVIDGRWEFLPIVPPAEFSGRTDFEGTSRER